MKQIEIISFTEAGAALAEKLRDGFGALGYPAGATSGKGRSQTDSGKPPVRVGDWARDHFATDAVLFFIGAAGIAVRAIAPHVKDKKTDPAVIVLDERGQFAVPILSGHIGEANLFAQMAAALTGGQAVLTTATDVNDLFAVDVLAHRNALIISDMTKAKLFSAALLESREARLYIPGEYADVITVKGDVPKEVLVLVRPDGGTEAQLKDLPTAEISPRVPDADGYLQLIPRCLTVGVGCRRGKSKEEIGGFLKEVFEEAGLDLRAVSSLASIDLKKDEEGLIGLASDLKVPFETFSADSLQGIEGDFTPSAFVAETTGVDNVCERAAVAAGGARLLLKKTARDGVTIAVGIKPVEIVFDRTLSG